jgi:hypothetical protein
VPPTGVCRRVLTGLPLRHLSPPTFKTSLASNSKRARARTASSPTHRIPWIAVGTSSSNGRPRGCNRARLVVALVSRGAAETAAWPRMRKRGGRVQPEPVRGLFVGG